MRKKNKSVRKGRGISSKLSRFKWNWEEGLSYKRTPKKLTIKINKIPTLKENQFNFSPRRTYRRRKMNTSNVRPRTSIKKSSTQLGRRTR